MSAKTWIFMAIFVGVLSLYPIGSAVSPRRIDAEGQKLAQFGELPVVEGGRIKPMDTVARTYLRLLSNRGEFYESWDKDEDHKLPAIRWMLDVMVLGLDSTDAEAAANMHPVVRIENEQVLAALKLQPRSGLRYRIKEIGPNFSTIQKEAEKAANKPKNTATLYDAKIAELHQHLQQFVKIAQFSEPRVLPPNEKSKEWQTLPFYALRIQAVESARQQARAELGLTREELKRMNEQQQMQLLRHVRDREQQLERDEYNRLLAAQSPLVLKWKDLLEAHRDKLQAEERRRKATPNTSDFATADRDVKQSVERFNAALGEIQKSYPDHLTPREKTTVAWETFFNKFEPFMKTGFLYALALILAKVSLLVWHKPLRWTSFSVLSLAVIIHTIGLIMRMYIQGRPPVTNLYSSAIFIGWGAVLLCMVLEAIFGRSIANIVGAFVGLATSIVAHNLGSGNDTLEMMQAVLDTNFWLATHVTCVTLGYTATFVAGFLGVLFILLGLATPLLDSELYKRLNQMIYGVVCFATLLSFTGTVLGGIWADQSWGRFWGWDPKENGAVLIVIWNAIVLHARWSGLIKQRGLAVMAIFGNIVTAWSWFGTNMLGIGLHAYGFMEAAVPAILAFDGIMIAIMLCGAVPPRHWRSFGGQFDAPLEVMPVSRPISRPKFRRA